MPLMLIRHMLSKNKPNISFSQQEIIGFVVLFFAAIFILTFNIVLGPVVLTVDRGRYLDDTPYIIFLILSLFFAKFISSKDLQVIQWLITFEIIIGVLEYIANVPTFFRNLTPINELPDSDLLYQRKVFGISANSSVLAAKTVYLFTITCLQLKTTTESKKKYYLFLAITLIGLVITFNRTALISVLVSLCIFFFKNIRLIIMFFLPLSILSLVNIDNILKQLNRGKSTIDYSGRDQIFSYFYSFWQENLLLGNMGKKLLWETRGISWHAHNSYLEFIASNGLIVTFLFIISWFFIFKKKTYIVIPILIYSLFQYGFLWGVTFYDIVIFSILYIYKPNTPLSYYKENPTLNSL